MMGILEMYINKNDPDPVIKAGKAKKYLKACGWAHPLNE